MQRIPILLVIALFISMTCGQIAESAGNSTAKHDSIGSATMKEDGTIILHLRAEGPGGAMGDAMFSYPPTHPEYESIRKHLGGIKAGESKPVPPWPEEKERPPASGAGPNSK